MKFHRLFLCLTVIFNPSLSQATEFGDQVTQAIEHFLDIYSEEVSEKDYRLEYEIGKIDPLIRLATCDNLPSVSFRQSPTRQINNTLEISCQSPKQWRFFVSSQIYLYGNVVSAAQTIRRGETITEGHLKLQQEASNQARYKGFSALEPVLGMVAKRTIRENSIITAAQLTPPTLIKRGDKVVIVAKNSNIAVKMNGIALNDGKLGQQISIRNSRSKRIVLGKVVAEGQAVVTL